MSKNLAIIIDYDAGNLRSVQRACHEVGGLAKISKDSRDFRDASRIIFPGVGAAGAAMRSIRKHGIDQMLVESFETGKPILGICMGLQISLTHSEEDDQDTIGLIDGQVLRFSIADPALKVPHMGWNEVDVIQPHPLLKHVSAGDEFYFVHSYYPVPRDDGVVFGETTYESTFCCALGSESFFGTQFHPEKSGRVGLELLSNFFQWGGEVAK